jgi:hypothetical protein
MSTASKAVKESGNLAPGVNEMPDIKIKSTGRIFYQVDSTLCAILGELHPENIERVQPPAPVQAVGQPPLPPKVPTWSCGNAKFGGPAIFLWMPTGEVIESHEHPNLLAKSFGTFRGQELKVPADIVEQYRCAWQRGTVPVR